MPRARTLFSKLLPSYFFISLLGLVILLLITRFAFRNFYYKEISSNLIQKARLIEDDIIKKLVAHDLNKLQESVNLLAVKSKNRITIILPSGVVAADSNYAPERMENHQKRAEVIEALKGKIGESIRFSPTLEENHLYVAIPLRFEHKIFGVLRNSVSIDQLETSLYLLTQNVLLWSVLLLVLLTYFIYVQAKKISSPLEEMKEQIENYSAEKFEENKTLKENSSIEILSLYGAFIKMREKLENQFQKINNQKNEQNAIFSSMLEGVITIDPNMNIYHINKAALGLFKYDLAGPVKGTPLLKVVNSERIFELAKELLKNHKTIVNEFEYKSGQVLNIHGTILESQETGMLGAVLVFNDITKMRELENHRKQFVANVSHELKTPLTAIQGYLETLREGEIEDKKLVKKFLDIMHRHSLRLKIIIDDLLSLSSIETDSEVRGLHLELEKIDPIIENVISLCLDKAYQREIKITYKGCPSELLLNRPLIEQALINLLDNAIKYGAEKSEIKILTEVFEDTLKIKIRDQGTGIAEIHHERLFERFYSVDKARSRELGGSGLGLSIVKHIALSHGGNISVTSNMGEGSTFTMELPLRKSTLSFCGFA